MTNIYNEEGYFIKAGIQNLARCLATLDSWWMEDTKMYVRYYDGRAPRYQQRMACFIPETVTEKRIFKTIQKRKDKHENRD